MTSLRQAQPTFPIYRASELGVNRSCGVGGPCKSADGDTFDDAGLPVDAKFEADCPHNASKNHGVGNSIVINGLKAGLFDKRVYQPVGLHDATPHCPIPIGQYTKGCVARNRRGGCYRNSPDARERDLASRWRSVFRPELQCGQNAGNSTAGKSGCERHEDNQQHVAHFVRAPMQGVRG